MSCRCYMLGIVFLGPMFWEKTEHKVLRAGWEFSRFSSTRQISRISWIWPKLENLVQTHVFANSSETSISTYPVQSHFLPGTRSKTIPQFGQKTGPKDIHTSTRVMLMRWDNFISFWPNSRKIWSQVWDAKLRSKQPFPSWKLTLI